MINDESVIEMDDVEIMKDETSTFLNNMKLPIHRWYRFSAGFSAQWVYDLINEQKLQGRFNVLDPFAGSGTTLLEAQNAGVDSYGMEAHPLIYEIALSKLSWDIDTNIFGEKAVDIIDQAKKLPAGGLDYPSLIDKCYPEDSLQKLDKLRIVIETLPLNDPVNRLLWLALVSILRTCAPVGTANWQYILPNKKSTRIIDPFLAYETKIKDIIADIKKKKLQHNGGKSVLLNEDARIPNSVPQDWVDLVITSPPYANNYDYADATRLEMSFLKRINGWKDLQSDIRPKLVRSCTQHVGNIVGTTDDILKNPILDPIQQQIWKVCKELETERLSHGGKKNYHTMLAYYFFDIANVLKELRPKCRDNSLQCWVIGDSAPYGVYAPVDEWIGELALSLGFKKYWFEKTRDRNVKWKNRKHTVPLKEGRLWITG